MGVGLVRHVCGVVVDRRVGTRTGIGVDGCRAGVLVIDDRDDLGGIVEAAAR
ncbi:hypothetical protein I552_4230 [Mycobacterium xenopi 3993]|nr:hypothetical protein I552_4230 [Mycobacterium xenopi 3993]